MEALKARLREPSTYIGVALLIQWATGKTISADLMASTAGTIITAVVAIGSFLGVILSESK